jgi:uncharacterized repeat protein (TIGR03803 family)
MRAINLVRMISLLFALHAVPVVSHAQTVTTLAGFNMTDGSKPYFGPLVQGPNGKLYGTTSGGGAGQNYGGTVFEIDLAGNLNTL